MKSERDGINPAAKPGGTGCVECLALGRMGHPTITSFEPGDRWFYDYRTEEFFAGPKLHALHSHPLDHPVPGPAGAVPSNWQTLLHE